MAQKQKKFYQHKYAFGGVICMAVIALFATATNAAVVSRGGTTARASARGNVAARMPSASVSTTTATATNTTTTTTTTTTAAADTEPEPEPEPVVIENKTSQFDDVLSQSSTSSNSDTSASALAELVAAQRAELDSQSAITTATAATATGNSSACDTGLRGCMREKCGDDFTECAGDTDTIWGNKMDACRNDIDATCTGEQYRLFASEIKADRDLNAQLAAYNAIINCGNQYNDCIVTECGTTFSKCLGKSAGDAAIAKCETIAKNCTEQDSGLASRAMQVFANLRVDAEEQVQRDEERLYELRDEMIAQCQTLGATFDERTFSCVYTVNFYAGDDGTLYASKKAYAGASFDCTPNWFGIDITTFMENAYRLTRSQTSASAAMLGSGLGVAAGAITSGAIDRAIDRQKAERAVKDAEKENSGDDGASAKEERQAERAEKKEERQAKRDEKKAERQAERDEKKEERQAERAEKKEEREAERAAKKDPSAATRKQTQEKISQDSKAATQSKLDSTISNQVKSRLSAGPATLTL